MADEQEVQEFTTRTVRDTQTRTVNGGVIVLLITREVRDDDGATVKAVQEDHVCTSPAEVGKLVTDFLSLSS